MKIEVYGSAGCKKCDKLKRSIEKLVEGREDIKVVKVEDPVELAKKGIMSTPAVTVDGEVKVKGRLPSKEEIEKLLL